MLYALLKKVEGFKFKSRKYCRNNLMYCITVPRMSALFCHRLPIYERATDHKYTKGCSHLGKKRGWDQV